MLRARMPLAGSTRSHPVERVDEAGINGAWLRRQVLEAPLVGVLLRRFDGACGRGRQGIALGCKDMGSDT